MASENVLSEQLMNWWMNAAQYATEALTIVLIFRLLRLRERRERIYFVFVLFLVVQLTETSAYFAWSRWGEDKMDYRMMWIGFTALLDALCLWLVYSLAKAVLAELPGIFRFSRMLLNIAFPLAILVAFFTAPGEYWVANGPKMRDPVDRLLSFCFVADRAIGMASVLILIAILAFILWFPVKMSKNLAIFSVGFVVYFTAKTGLELLRSYSTSGLKNTPLLSTIDSVVLITCFLYWIAFIVPQGEAAQVRMGHSWRLAEQNRLVEQLESLNGALMRSSQRLPL
jgi:hypothetical protein